MQKLFESREYIVVICPKCDGKNSLGCTLCEGKGHVVKITCFLSVKDFCKNYLINQMDIKKKKLDIFKRKRRENIIMDRKDIIDIVNNDAPIPDSILDQDKKIITAAKHYKQFMLSLGIDLQDPNAKDTPYRVAKMFVTEFCKSFYLNPPELTVFPNTKKYDEYVILKHIPYYSICSHHHVPFYGKVYIAYHPDKYVLGLSKFARVVSYFASKPQIQEELTQEITDFLEKHLTPKGLMVVITGNHMCMTSRGAKAEGSITTTSAIRGIKNSEFDKKEALALFKNELSL